MDNELNQKRRDLVVGLDAGGTRTRAVLATAEDGRPVGEGAAGPGNALTVPPPQLTEHLAEAVGRAVPEQVRDRVVAVAGGFAGATGAADDEPGRRNALAALTAALHRLGIDAGPPVIGSDIEAAFASAPGAPADGLALVAGTGAVAMRITDRRGTVTVDGDGWLLGDDGSGFWIGRAAVRAALRMADGRGAPTVLAEAVGRELGVPADALPGGASGAVAGGAVRRLSPDVVPGTAESTPRDGRQEEAPPGAGPSAAGGRSAGPGRSGGAGVVGGGPAGPGQSGGAVGGGPEGSAQGGVAGGQGRAGVAGSPGEAGVVGGVGGGPAGPGPTGVAESPGQAGAAGGVGSGSAGSAQAGVAGGQGQAGAAGGQGQAGVAGGPGQAGAAGGVGSGSAGSAQAGVAGGQGQAGAAGGPGQAGVAGGPGQAGAAGGVGSGSAGSAQAGVAGGPGQAGAAGGQGQAGAAGGPGQAGAAGGPGQVGVAGGVSGVVGGSGGGRRVVPPGDHIPWSRARREAYRRHLLPVVMAEAPIRLARLAPLVVAAARDAGDPVALAILDEAADQLTESVRALEPTAGERVVATGGLLGPGGPLTDRLEARLRALGLSLDWVPDGCRGAVALARLAHGGRP
ncbi:hypothetical protein [Streptomyces afghaniensis]|uniref:hypothetical protein n=1 Tax=Streptomyces afghaniensis TaxID=66865 RepID=UPI002784844C|nr:hypothetical protein [Streptomyces afghaniensis]MDQ1015452.1 N-acetylglucosamine kinase-like BadF-type ATPase [Streptomyces afghaniensis]